MAERKRRMKAKKPKPWTMPPWMEPYREFINNTGGNSVETLVNDSSIVQVNAPLAMLSHGVQAQVGLLYRLREEGWLREGRRTDV